MFNYRKIEHLCAKKDIEKLYSLGKSRTANPFKIYWHISDFNSPYPSRVVISVPKRIFKKAHDRNRIRRQIKESYRLNKDWLHKILTERKTRIDILILYIGNQAIEYKLLEESLQKILRVAVEQISNE
jgi:ribonuclease P protein component